MMWYVISKIMVSEFLFLWLRTCYNSTFPLISSMCNTGSKQRRGIGSCKHIRLWQRERDSPSIVRLLDWTVWRIWCSVAVSSGEF